MKPASFKRILAYMIDIFVITCLTTLITYFIPENKEYNASLKEYTDLIKEYSNENISKKDFLESTNNIVYKMNKESIPTTIVTTVLSLGYFVVLAYFMNGQTLGKKIMKLQIISDNNNKLTMNNYLLRGFLFNSILMNILGIIAIIFLNKTTYITTNDIITYIFSGLYIITFGLILFRQDGRGLHDLIAHTKVIDIKNKEILDIQEELKNNKDSKLQDAEIIGENKFKM